MKVFFPLVCLIALSSCGSSEAPNQPTGAVTPASDESLRANFRDFLGTYDIQGCTSTRNQAEACKYSMAEVKIASEQGYSVLVIARTYVSRDGAQKETRDAGVSFAGEPEVACRLAYGESVCTASDPQDHPGSYLNVKFSRDETGRVQYREESVDPQHSENDGVLTLTLSRK
jgi:hypothetical protein